MIPEPDASTIVGWFDANGDLHAVAQRSDAYVEADNELARWYIVDNGQGYGEPLTWTALLDEMRGDRGPSELVSNGRIDAGQVSA